MPFQKTDNLFRAVIAVSKKGIDTRVFRAVIAVSKKGIDTREGMDAR